MLPIRRFGKRQKYIQVFPSHVKGVGFLLPEIFSWTSSRMSICRDTTQPPYYSITISSGVAMLVVNRYAVCTLRVFYIQTHPYTPYMLISMRLGADMLRRDVWTALCLGFFVQVVPRSASFVGPGLSESPIVACISATIFSHFC